MHEHSLKYQYGSVLTEAKMIVALLVVAGHGSVALGTIGVHKTEGSSSP